MTEQKRCTWCLLYGHRASNCPDLDRSKRRTKTMKSLFCAALALAVAGCGYVDRAGATLTGYSRICIDGVEYLQFTSGATVAFTPDGKVKKCSSE